MIKFGRNYKLTINMSGDDDSDQIIIEYPITVSFIVKRDLGSSLNSLDIEIFNLNETTRNRIFQDRFGYFGGYNGSLIYRYIKLEAGYGDELYTVFEGNLFEAGSYRRGADLITYINARDGGYDTQISQSFITTRAPVSQKELIQILTDQFQHLDVGAIGDNGVMFNRAVSVTGNTWENLMKYSEGKAFIDLQKVYAIQDFEVVEEQAILIDPSTGLLDTPRRDDAFISLNVLFEPSVSIGRLAQLRSTVMPQYDGNYKICSIRHACVISGAVGGECRTTLGLLIDGQLFGEFQRVPLAPITAG